MPNFYDAVNFLATSSGTGDFVVASAIQGYRTPLAAAVPNGATSGYYATSTSGNEWELGITTYATGTVTAARTTVIANHLGTTAKVNFTAAPNVGFVELSRDMLGFDFANSFTTAQQEMARKNLFCPPGCLADGTTDDLAALVAYRNAVIADGTNTMFLTAGTYAISGKLELGFAGLKVVPLGSVTFKHTGTGIAISFDAGAAPSTATIFGIEFGWGNDIYVTGNAATTDLIFVRSCHHMKLGANVRNGTTGMRVNFSVLSRFRLTCSSNEAAFTTRPVNGLLTNVRNAGETVTDCTFDLVVEGVSGVGVDLTSCIGCEFTGTAEACGTSGVVVESSSSRNTFTGFDCEANSTVTANQQDWNIQGDNNTFINCIGVATTSTLENIVSGPGNTFIGGLFAGMTVHASAARNIMKGVYLTGTPILNSTSATYEGCTDGSGTPVGDAWVSYTSTFSATTGTATVVAFQKTVGKIVYVNISVTFTSAVTGTFAVTLPANAKRVQIISGMLTSNGGGATGFTAAASNSMSVLDSAGAQFTANGSVIVLTGAYEAT